MLNRMIDSYVQHHVVGSRAQSVPSSVPLFEGLPHGVCVSVFARKAKYLHKG